MLAGMVDAMIDLDTWGYLGVFVAAATPWIEILFVIPAGVAVGLDATAVGLVAFVGNAAPVIGIVAGFEAVQRARERRRGADGSSPREPSSRAQRARRLLQRYGLPLLALAGPAVTGIHLATVVALATGGRRVAVTVWMVGSLAAWTIALTALSAAGSALLRG